MIWLSFLATLGVALGILAIGIVALAIIVLGIKLWEDWR